MLKLINRLMVRLHFSLHTLHLQMLHASARMAEEDCALGWRRLADATARYNARRDAASFLAMDQAQSTYDSLLSTKTSVNHRLINASFTMDGK